MQRMLFLLTKNTIFAVFILDHTDSFTEKKKVFNQVPTYSKMSVQNSVIYVVSIYNIQHKENVEIHSAHAQLQV